MLMKVFVSRWTCMAVFVVASVCVIEEGTCSEFVIAIVGNQRTF